MAKKKFTIFSGGKVVKVWRKKNVYGLTRTPNFHVLQVMPCKFSKLYEEMYYFFTGTPI